MDNKVRKSPILILSNSGLVKSHNPKNAITTPIFDQNNIFFFTINLNTNGVKITDIPVIKADFVTVVKVNPHVCSTNPPPKKEPRTNPAIIVFF